MTRYARLRALNSIFEKLDFDNNGMIGIDDIVDVTECLDASLNLNLSALTDVRNAALSIGIWLRKSGGTVNIKELANLFHDCAGEGGGVFLYLGRLLVLQGASRAAVGGKEMVGKIFGFGVKAVGRDEFKQGLASLKPKLSVEELEGVMKNLVLGNELINIEQFIELCFPPTTEHRPLQKLLKKHFDSDGRMLKNFLLLCGDVDYETTGWLEWKIFLRVLTSSTLLLTTSQTLTLTILLTRDGGTKVSYTEMSRIAKGDILSMPQTENTFAKSARVLRDGAKSSTPSTAVSVQAAITQGTPNSLKELRKKAGGGGGGGSIGRPRKLLGNVRKQHSDSSLTSGGSGSVAGTPLSTRAAPGGAMARQSSSKRSLSVTFKERSPEKM